MANPLGNITGGVVGAGVGIAAANIAEPILEVERQQAWKDNAYRVLDLGALAQLVAQGLAKFDEATDHAKRNGFNEQKLFARVQLELKAPGVAEVLELWRRNASRPASEQITEAQVDHALAKTQIEPQYWPTIKELFSERLDPAVIAVAIQRGIMKDPGFLPVGPPTSSGKVPAFPVSRLDPIAEAVSSGVDSDRLFVETAIVGNPASPDLAARMTFREIIDRVDFDRAIAEGNTRNEWADFLFEAFRQIPTAHDGIEARLRGWVDDEGMYAQTARHGMSEADTDLIFKVTGRPPSWHQVWIGLQRGGTYNGPTDVIHPAFLKSLQESNIRPEWYNLLWHSRYNYPAPFVLRSLTQSGDLQGYDGLSNQAAAEQILLYEGWEPTLAKTVSTKWAGAKGGAAKEATAADLLTLWDGEKATAPETLTALEGLGYSTAEAQLKMDVVEARRVSSAKNSAIGDLHTDYKKGGLSTAKTVAALEQLGVSTAGAAEIEQAWRVFLTAEGGAPPA